jgi:hypothetical protein
MGSLIKQCFPYDTFLLLLPLFQIRCEVPPSARALHYFDESTHDSDQRLVGKPFTTVLRVQIT